MFFQQTHNARNAVEEAEENELGAYYLDPPPWIISSKKRMSMASAMSSRSRRSGDHFILPSRSTSMESAQQPSRSPSLGSPAPGFYSRQSSAVRSGSSLQGPAGFAANRATGNPVWRRIKQVLSSSLGLFLLIQTYLCVGAFCFMWLEAAKETEKMNEMADLRHGVAEQLVNCSGNVSCHKEKLRSWEKALVKFPQIYLEIEDSLVWSWTDSYYCSFTIISTIGYGNVTPLSVMGRLFAVVYAVIGIPLMLLFITDIGNKLARWTKIAIIKFRQLKYKLSQRFKTNGTKVDKDTKESGDVKREEGEGGEETHGGGGEVSEEVGGDASRRHGGLGIWNIPEVHINIAMSTLDEEACEVETKDIGGAGGVEARYHGHGKEQLDYRDDAGLHVGKDNSDYGGSSTGVEGCIADTAENAHETVPPVSEDVTSPDGSVPASTEESTPTVAGSTVDSPLHSDDTLDSSSRPTAEDAWSVDGRSRPDNVVVNIDADRDIRLPESAGVSPRERDDATIEDARTESETSPRSNRTDALGVEREMYKNAPSDVLHTSSFQQRTAVRDNKCDKCGQSMPSVPHVSTDDVSDTNSDENMKRTSERVSENRTHDSPDQKQPSHDSSPVNVHAKPPLHESILINADETIPRTLSTYFCHDPVTDEQSATEHEKLSRKKSRSLESISTLHEEDGRYPEPSRCRPALRGARGRRTSAPNVSFQTESPKPNGRLPNRHLERCEERDDPTRTHTDEDRDRTATDSGVASSTSNSTECSPKRRPNSIHLRVEDSSDDSGGEDVVVDEDDVMDSEEEKNFERLRQLRFGAARPSLAGREAMRVSETDIAMLSIPIWLALIMLLVYLLIGAGCFVALQKWSFLDGFYYCFISLSTIGFGDLVFLPQNLHAGLIFSFLYSFFGLCFTSMCMSLSSMELTLLSRRLASKFGTYRGRIRSLREKRWASRRRRAIRAPSPER